MNNIPKLSVIIPVYNVEYYLDQCINSVLNQSFNDFEIILINDGSTDNSGEICDEFARKYSMIQVLHTKNLGVSSARNSGIAKAKGEYIHFMDSDDTIDKNMYEEFNNILKNYQYDLILSGRRNCNLFNKKVNNFQMEQDFSASDRNTIADFLLKIDTKDKNWVMNVIWNKWFKRSVLLEHKIKFNFNVCPGEDFIFVGDVLKTIDSLYVIGKSYYNYYIRGEESLLGRFYGDVLTRRPFIHNAHKDIYVSYGIYEQYKDNINFYEGRRMYEELFSISKKNCKLSIKQKKEHIKNLIQSEHFNYAIDFLNKTKNKYDKRIAYLILKRRNTNIAILFIYLFSYVKMWRGRFDY